MARLRYTIEFAMVTFLLTSNPPQMRNVICERPLTSFKGEIKPNFAGNVLGFKSKNDKNVISDKSEVLPTFGVTTSSPIILEKNQKFNDDFMSDNSKVLPAFGMTTSISPKILDSNQLVKKRLDLKTPILTTTPSTTTTTSK